MCSVLSARPRAKRARTGVLTPPDNLATPDNLAMLLTNDCHAKMSYLRSLDDGKTDGNFSVLGYITCAVSGPTKR